jgi:hypothetical protein
MSDRRQAPNCPVCGAAPLTLCAPGCTYIEQMNELAASTLEGLTDEEKRVVTERVTFGCTDEEQAAIDAALNYREAVRESTRLAGVADEFAHQYFNGWQGELNACLLAAVDNLVAARARTGEGSK